MQAYVSCCRHFSLVSRLGYDPPSALEDEVPRVAARRGLLQRGEALAVMPLADERTKKKHKKQTKNKKKKMKN